jgi:hypothetical protein
MKKAMPAKKGVKPPPFKDAAGDGSFGAGHPPFKGGKKMPMKSKKGKG